MNKIILKWKLGWKVIVRYMLFGLALWFVSIGMMPFQIIKNLCESHSLYVKISAGILAVIAYGGVLPLLMYWAAQWTGQLQGSDKKTFDDLKTAPE
jgi:hypothetical protein